MFCDAMLKVSNRMLPLTGFPCRLISPLNYSGKRRMIEDGVAQSLLECFGIAFYF